MTTGQISLNDTPKLKQRLKSYIDWKSPKHIVSLAAAGFRYTGELDRVKCDYCNKKVVQWSLHDDPLEVHVRFSPSCVFLRNLGFSPLLPIPRFAQFSFYADRLESVRTVPEVYHHVLPSFDAIAESGFFYQGTLDRMCCYFCGVILKDWDATTDPILIHIRFRPQCVHIVKLCQLRNEGRHSLDTDLPEDVNLQLQSLREFSCCRKIGQELVDAGGNWTSVGESEGAASSFCEADRKENSEQEIENDSKNDSVEGQEPRGLEEDDSDESLDEDGLPVLDGNTDIRDSEDGPIGCEEETGNRGTEDSLGEDKPTGLVPDSDTRDDVQYGQDLKERLDIPHTNSNRGNLRLKQASETLFQGHKPEGASGRLHQTEAGYTEADPSDKDSTGGLDSDAKCLNFYTHDTDLEELYELKRSLESMEFFGEEIEERQLFGACKNHEERKPEPEVPETKGKDEEDEFIDRKRTKNFSGFVHSRKLINYTDSATDVQEDATVDDISGKNNANFATDISDDDHAEASHGGSQEDVDPLKVLDTFDDSEDEPENFIEPLEVLKTTTYKINVESLFLQCPEILSETEDHFSHFSLPNMRFYGWYDPDCWETSRQEEQIGFNTVNLKGLSDMFFGDFEVPSLHMDILASLPTTFEGQSSPDIFQRTILPDDSTFTETNACKKKPKTNKPGYIKKIIEYISKKRKSFSKIGSIIKLIANTFLTDLGERKYSPYVRLRCISDIKTVLSIMVVG